VLLVSYLAKARLFVATLVLVIGSWLAVSVLVFFSGGYDSPFLIVFLAVVMMGSIFLGRLGGFAAFLSTLLSVAVIFQMDAVGITPTPVIQYAISDQAVVLAMSFFIMFGSSLLLGNTIELTSELEEAYDQTLQGYVRSLEFRDGTTKQHADRVVTLTARVAESYGYSRSEMDNIKRGALLHDIGKIGISDTILLKPEFLTEDERKEMERHPLIAEEMLSGIKFLKNCIAIPLYHHERWDGAGYPYGLSAEAIPQEARIFAVVDVWDALLSDRPYRIKWSQSKAREYILGETGKHFDPDVVDRFMVILDAAL
jgi:HD-GYP domain-containing protein (c-di-GMP phosphodiesterase class II)